MNDMIKFNVRLIETFLILLLTNIVITQNIYFPKNRILSSEKSKYLETLGQTNMLLQDVKPFTIHQQRIIPYDDYLSATYVHENWNTEHEFDIKFNSFKSDAKLSHIFQWENGNSSLYGRINLVGEVLSNKMTALNGAYEYQLFGNIGDNVHYLMSNRQNVFLTEKDFSLKYSQLLAKDLFTKSSLSRNDINSSDYNESFLAYEIDHNNLLFFGKIPWEIGTGESGKFILNGYQNTPITSLGLSLKFWRFTYHALHGSLLATELTNQITDDSGALTNKYKHIPDKYMVNHRFELDVTNDLKLHYNELIVYGNRSADFTYMNPFSFLRSQEHEQQDRDNAMISLGFKYRLKDYHLLTYHDILLDEWKISEISAYFTSDTHWFGNKQAMLNGLTWAYKDVQIWLEHVSIAPYVYSHKYDVNRYTHNGQSLGYSTGPNSKVYFTKINYFINDNFLVSASFKQTYKGTNLDSTTTTNWNIGGDIFYGDDTRFKETRKFLEGNVIKNNVYTFKLLWEPNSFYSLSLDIIIDEKNDNRIGLFTQMSF